ncbi:MAG: DUF3467 domain-containing protein [Candidatus Methanofastidiosia archaeon]
MNSRKEKQPIQQPKIETPEENRIGIYADFVNIRHTPFGFIMDFGAFIPEDEGFRVLARIKMSPEHFKSVFSVIKEQIEKYEKTFGEIKGIGEKVSKSKRESYGIYG